MPFPMPLLFITAVKDICAINTFTSEGILRQRDKVKITDQSEALFKQKRWFKTKKKRPHCIKVGNGPLMLDRRTSI